MGAKERFKGKRFAVVGFGAEGRSAAYFLAKSGARVEVFDAKQESEFPVGMVADLRQAGIIFYFGAMGPFSGFDAIVRSPGVPPHAPELVFAAKQGIPFASPTRIFFDLCPCPIVGVTGTKGKGTTCSLLHQMLLAAGKDAHLCGNIGAPALDFLDKLNSDSIVVYELSSFQLMDLEKSPELAIVLMVTSEHLDFHTSQEEYVSSKANILKFQKKGDRAVINVDYPASREMAALARGEVFSVSVKGAVGQGAYVEGKNIMLIREGAVRKLMPAAEVPLVGTHNFENVCAAAMAASLLGVPDPVIAQAVRAFKALPHRLEFIREVNGVRYYNDSFSTTPESAIAALRSFQGPKVVILGGSSKGADWNELATVLAGDRSIRAVIGIGEEWPRIKKAIAEKAGDIPQIEGLERMPEIAQAAANAAQPGDVVLLSPGCASFGLFKNYKDRGEQFAAAARALP